MKHPNSLSHDERLRKRGSIRRLFESGKGGFVYPLRYMWYVVDTDEVNSNSVEVMFSVPKRFHKRANRRNTLRRRVKESYRLQKSIVLEVAEGKKPQKIEMALLYSTKDFKSYKTISNAVRKVLTNIKNEL